MVLALSFQLAGQGSDASVYLQAPNAANYQQKTLADLVLEKIREKQQEQGVQPSTR